MVTTLSQTEPAADAKLVTVEGRQNLWRAIFSCWLGTTLEFADLGLYSFASGIIFGDVFFPEASPIIALLSSFATWSVAYIARPIGAVFFGWLGDRKGRKLVMVITISLMGGSTTLIGLIPSYSSIGMWAPICLVLLRFLQGLGAGAELSGGTLMLGEYAPTKRRGLVTSVIGLGSNCGTLLASLVWLSVVQMDHQVLLNWGWRIPFLCSILITLVALWMRHYMHETPVFELHKAQILAQKEQMTAIEQSHDDNIKSSFIRNKAFWIMVGLRIGQNGPSLLVLGFIVGYVSKVLMVDKSVATTAVLIATLFGFLVNPLAGWLSDCFGRRIVYRCLSFLTMIYALPVFMLLDSRNSVVIISTVIVGMSLSTMGTFSTQAAWGVELFGVRNRYTKMAVGKELGAMISGGTAPMVASIMLSYTGHWWPITIYFFMMATISFVTTFVAPETRGRDLNIIDDAI